MSIRVNRVGLGALPQERTFSVSVGMSEAGHTGPCRCTYADAGILLNKRGYVSISFIKMNGTR